MSLTENEIMSCHVQALKDAAGSCFELGRNADPTYLAPRGKHYANLKEALMRLEGSARQLAHFRGDARWLKLGFIYARLQRAIQAAYMQRRWGEFNAMRKFFGEEGRARMAQLSERKTGTTGLILPQPGQTGFMLMPDHKVPGRTRVMT